MFRKALYSTSVRGPSDIWFWIYALYPNPVLLLFAWWRLYICKDAWIL
jgi:hypothetical protein